MTAAERAAYLAWQRTHQPGAPGLRASARMQQQHDREAAKLLASTRTPVGDTAAIDELTIAIAALRRELERFPPGADAGAATHDGVFQ
jgi:hypothetical protein